MWKQLTKILLNILEANTLIQDVYAYENIDYRGTPFACLIPSANESDYSTTTENSRVYAFTLFLYNERGEDRDDISNCEDTMRELVDSVLDDLDKNYRLTGLELRDGYHLLNMEAAPSAWGYQDRESQLRVAVIDIAINFAVDTNLIT